MAVKVAVVAPTATLAELGTVKAEGIVLDRVTTAPPLGAALESVTVQVVEADAAREVLAHCSEVGTAGATNDRAALAVTPFKVAVAVAF